MTSLNLLFSLKSYCEEITKHIRLPARVTENGTEAGERPPKVFIGNLPDKEAEKKEAPYILLKLLTKKSDEEESICRVRIICVTFSEDKQENYIQCLNVITKIEMKLLEDVEKAERELDNFMEANSTLEDLEMVRYLQEQVQYRYSKYLDYIGLNDKEVLN